MSARNFEMTRPDATTGARPSHPASRGANAIQFGAENNSPELSPVFSSDGIALLKTSYVAQALLDVAALVFGLLFICALAGSVPLAIALLMFASF